ncbi:hypothetical protein LMJ53_10005 [Rheinheimera sp. UJ51]|uniref:hypothetical protein n=1 Tax=Rheinheimera sp. UJ51 TaxID=2892446 RepID=UPI001E50F8C5|nr:hypothetical protein [Rheinheimera sp. UJ51]MCC5452051.1 hypothetical protein [Rheinheimera sp. UJ51]
MKIYWSFNHIPELSHLSASEKKRLWQKASSRCLQSWLGWLGLIFCGLSGSLGADIGEMYELKMLGTVLGGATGGLIYAQIVTYLAVKHHKELLAEPRSSHDPET